MAAANGGVCVPWWTGGGGVREMDVGGVRERERLLTIRKHFHLKLKLTL